MTRTSAVLDVDAVGVARALVAEWSAAGRFAPRSDAWLRSFDLDFSRRLGAAGLIGMTWPKEYGGAAATNVARLAVTEELLRAGAPVAAHWIGDRQIGPAILRHGTDSLKRDLLPRIISGSAVFCLGMSEPNAGSDLAAVTTTARWDSDHWSLRGRKIWTSHAHRATHAYVLARTSTEGRKHEGLTEFIVDLDQPGVTVTPIVDLSGERHFNEVLFEDATTPDAWVLGEVGGGWRQVTSQLAHERGGAERVLSTYPLLRMLLDPERALDIGDERLVGQLIARLGVLRQVCYDVASAMDAGESTVAQAAALKYAGNAFELALVEVVRSVGLASDSLAGETFGQALLASPGFTLRGGAADVLLSIISKNGSARD